MGFLQSLGLRGTPGTVVLEQESLEHVASLAEGGYRGALALHGGQVWVLTPGDGTLTRFDPQTITANGVFEVGRGVTRLLVDERGPLLVHRDAQVTRLDPVTGTERQRAQLPEGTAELVSAEGLLWGLSARDPDRDGAWSVSLVQVDPSTLGVLREVDLGRSIFSGAPHIADGKVVALVEVEPRSMGEAVLDARTGERLPADQAPPRLKAMAADGRSLWRRKDRMVHRLDAATEQVQASYKMPADSGTGAVLAAGRLWVVNYRRPRHGESQYLD